LNPGEEESFDWTSRGRAYDVTVCGPEDEGSLFTVVFTDITDQHMTEEIHVNARHYLEEILADIPLGVAVLNSELKITSTDGHYRGFGGCHRRIAARAAASRNRKPLARDV